MTDRASIIFTFQVDGFHRWPSPPAARHEYLSARHHHRFFVRVELEVRHDDREFEFIEMAGTYQKMFQHWMDSRELETCSCEMMARRLLANLPVGREARVEVLEDGIHGGAVCRTSDGLTEFKVTRQVDLHMPCPS